METIHPLSPSSTLTEEQIKAEQSSFISKVYGWMSIALILTAFSALYIASTPSLIELIFGNRIIFYGLLIGELLLVGYLSAAVARMSSTMAIVMFLVYACLNGVTLSAIFLVFTAGSIASTFLITAGTFGVMSLYGYFTKRDLTSLGNLLMMGLIGLIIASLVNMFFQNDTLYWITTYAGILIFVGLVAYDTSTLR